MDKDTADTFDSLVAGLADEIERDRYTRLRRRGVTILTYTVLGVGACIASMRVHLLAGGVAFLTTVALVYRATTPGR